MPTHIEINGFEVQIFEKMYDYVCNVDFSNYADEEVDISSYEIGDAEASLPKVLVRKINLYEDVNFLIGMPYSKQISKYEMSFLKQLIKSCRIYAGQFQGR